jgi:hypothetical protein
MKKVLIALSTATLLSIGGAVYAQDEELCLDCHEPAEDWEGMSAEEILETASDPSIKRHADNADFTQEQLKAIIATLLGGG